MLNGWLFGLDLTQYHQKIRHCTRQIFGVNHQDIEDLEQEALMGFMKAYSAYDKSKSSNLFSYCFQKAKWRCYDYLRKNKKYLAEADVSVSSASTHENIIEEALTQQRVNEVLSSFSERHQELLLSEIYDINADNRKVSDYSQSTKYRVINSYYQKCAQHLS